VKKNPKGNGYIHYISDNNSKNHTLYNGKRIEDGDVIVLKDNDEIVLGRTLIRFNE
jgi:pSer/pThr/pTyr-binding forkhead associated (FHA) protein